MSKLIFGLTGLLLIACGDLDTSNAYLIKNECEVQAGSIICSDGTDLPIPEDQSPDTPLDEPTCIIKENKNYKHIWCGKSKYKIYKGEK